MVTTNDYNKNAWLLWATRYAILAIKIAFILALTFDRLTTKVYCLLSEIT